MGDETSCNERGRWTVSHEPRDGARVGTGIQWSTVLQVVKRCARGAVLHGGVHDGREVKAGQGAGRPPRQYVGRRCAR